MEKMTSPFIPEKGENFYFKYCNAVEKQGLKTKERYITESLCCTSKMHVKCFQQVLGSRNAQPLTIIA